MSDSQQSDQRGEDEAAEEAPQLRPEDQERVDGFLRRGVNSVERKPFRPLRLMIMLVLVVVSLSLLSQWLAHWAGVY
jgi:hypothetical protein